MKESKKAAKISFKEGLKAAKEAANATRRISSKAAEGIAGAARGGGGGGGDSSGKDLAKQGKKAVENRKVIL